MATPFGIRRRIKRLLGMPVDNNTQNTEDEGEKVSIVVVGPKGTEETGKGKPGQSLLMVSVSCEHPIASGCSESTCGTCRVEILEGAENISAQDGRERATLKENNFPTTYRLACRATLDKGSARVRAFETM